MSVNIPFRLESLRLEKERAQELAKEHSDSLSQQVSDLQQQQVECQGQIQLKTNELEAVQTELQKARKKHMFLRSFLFILRSCITYFLDVD